MRSEYGMVLQMLIILGLSALLSVITLALRKAVLKREDMLKMAEIQAYNRELLAARRKRDQKAIQKLEKKKEYIQRLNAEVSKKNLIVMFGSLLIFFTFYPMAASFFGTEAIGVMPAGLDIPFISEGGKLHFYGWFILSFFAVNLPISKLMRVSFGAPEVEKSAPEKPKDKK